MEKCFVTKTISGHTPLSARHTTYLAKMIFLTLCFLPPLEVVLLEMADFASKSPESPFYSFLPFDLLSPAVIQYSSDIMILLKGIFFSYSLGFFIHFVSLKIWFKIYIDISFLCVFLMLCPYFRSKECKRVFFSSE